MIYLSDGHVIDLKKDHYNQLLLIRRVCVQGGIRPAGIHGPATLAGRAGRTTCLPHYHFHDANSHERTPSSRVRASGRVAGPVGSLPAGVRRRTGNRQAARAAVVHNSQISRGGRGTSTGTAARIPLPLPSVTTGMVSDGHHRWRPRTTGGPARTSTRRATAADRRRGRWRGISRSSVQHPPGAHGSP